MSHKTISKRPRAKQPLARETWRDKYAPAPKGTLICKKCQNIYFKKRWHHSLDKKTKTKVSGKAGFTLCPACVMVGNHRYEGELIVENVPEEIESEFVRAVKGYGRRAEEINPQHRIIGFEKKRGFYRATVTENQMAARLGKHLKQVFKKVDLKITRSAEPFKLDRVFVSFSNW